MDDDEPMEDVEDGPEPAVQAYLRSAGLADPAIWAEFGLGGVGEADLARLLSWRQRRNLRDGGLCWPTRDPRAPEQIAGLVRLSPVQHKHRFITPPSGLGCAVDLSASRRVILCDTPLTVLRLAEAGVRDLALCEDPVVLAPLRDWLAGREIVLLSHRQRGLDAMAAQLGGLPQTVHLIGSQSERMAGEVRRLLGVIAPPPAARIDPTPHLLHRIADYARCRLYAGDGAQAIQARGLAHAELLNAYDVGYLPADWQQVLSRADEPMMSGRSIGHSVVFPAVDPDGAVVDLFTLRLHDGGGTAACWDVPRGLIGARIVTACSSVILADRVADLARLWAEGHRNVLLVRGVDDLRQNAARLVTAGVRTARIDTWHDRPGYFAVCRDRGIEARDGPTMVTHPDGPPVAGQRRAVDDPGDDEPFVLLEDDDPLGADGTDNITIVSVDRDRGLATFQAGDLTYVVEIPWEPTTTLEVLARRLGRVHRDRFDLASAAQRNRFSDAAGRRLQVEPAIIDGHLVALLDLVREAMDAPEAPTGIDGADAGTEALLRDPALLDHLTAGLGAAGWVGDDAAKRLGLLCIAGRLLDDPPWLLLRGPAAVTAGPLGLLADCVPPEWRLHCSRLTEASLYHQDRDALRHRVLILDDAATLRPEALTSLRILQTRGGLAVTQAERDPATGRLRTRCGDARGPVVLLAATATETALAELAISLPLDASPAQTARVLAAQASRRQGATDARPQTIERVRAVLRRLERLPVLIPFADRIAFPATRLEHRRDHDRFLGLIEAGALLHQHQRPRVEGQVIATEADFHHALRAAGAVLGQDGPGLSDRALPVLAALRTRPDHDWTLAEIAAALPHLSRGTLRRAVDDLIHADVVLSPRAGRGRQARMYQLVDATAGPSSATAIRLLAAPAAPERNWPIGQGVANSVTNLSPVQDVAYA